MDNQIVSQKHIVFCIHRFYPEVASTAQIMTELIEDLAKWYKITVIAIEPHDFVSSMVELDRWGTNVSIKRLRLGTINKNSRLSRIKHLVHYFLLAVRAAIKIPNMDMLFVISQPPIVGGMIGIVVSRLKRVKLVYNIQDFNPEQTEAVSYFKNKIVLKVAKYIDSISCIQADRIILVGRDMVDTLKNRGISHKVKGVSVINNWADERSIVPTDPLSAELKNLKQEWGILDKFVVMYSGNLGLYYDLEGIIRALSQHEWPLDILFLFVGDGVVKPVMEDLVKTNYLQRNVIFKPFQDRKNLNYSLAVADVHLVVNQRGIKGVSVPSKIYGVMAAGRPVLGVLESGSEARMLIEDSQCGICCEPGEYDAMVQMISDFYQLRDTKQIDELGLNGRKYLEQNLSRNRSVEQYHREFESLWSKDRLSMRKDGKSIVNSISF